MVEAKQQYMLACLNEYGDVSLTRHGKEFDFLAIENKTRELGLAAKQKISYSDLLFFKDEALWPFELFPALPPENWMQEKLKDKLFDFEALPKNENKLIRELHAVVRSIDLVSIILRFFRPEHYGIISPPVEKILEVRRGENVVKTYINYLRNLRDIKEAVGFRQTAEVDMALWVLYHKCYAQPRDHAVWERFKKDELLRRIRVKNLVSPLDSLSHARLAEALLDVKPDLAALIACYELERLIRRYARLKGPTFTRRDSRGHLPPLNEVITNLREEDHIDERRKDLWFTHKRARDHYFHEGIEPRAKMSSLIEEVKGLEDEVLTLEDLQSP